jgi:hypothetical protein
VAARAALIAFSKFVARKRSTGFSASQPSDEAECACWSQRAGFRSVTASKSAWMSAAAIDVRGIAYHLDLLGCTGRFG